MTFSATCFVRRGEANMGLKNYAKNAFRRLNLDVRFADKHDALTMQKRLLASTDVRSVIDGGGFVGLWTRQYLEAFPRATIHTFEPFPESFAALQQTFAADSRVVLNQAALSDATGEKTLFVNERSSTSSLLPIDPDIGASVPDPSWVKPKSRVTIPAVTI